MSPVNILVAAAVLAVLLLATCAIVAVRRWRARVDAQREAAQRRIIDLRERIVDEPGAGRGGARGPHRRYVAQPGGYVGDE